MTKPTAYIDMDGETGEVVAVIHGLGDKWISARGRHRVKSPKLPPRDTREEAQADLDAYARARKWKPMPDEPEYIKEVPVAETKVIIDPEFKSLIPPLAAVEREQLEANIETDGCRDPLVIWRGLLLDGHNRHEICERLDIDYKTVSIELPDRNAAMVWIINNQFGRRNLTVFARSELALKLEPLLAPEAKRNQEEAGKYGSQGGRGKKKQNPSANISGRVSADRETRTQVAKAAGVSHETIRAAKYVQEHADEATKAKLRTDPNVKLHRVAKDLRETKQRNERQAKRTAAAKDTILDSRILVGDFRKFADKIPDGSVSLIFTDPPYDRKAAAMFPDLAEFASRKLCDGGSLLCYVGQLQLRDALNAFADHLRYWWTIACLHSGGATVMREYGINNHWKAVLWFVKGTRDNKSDMVNDTMSGGKEKDHHEWQQASAEAQYWIEHLCPKDGIVLDPFLGGGTTAAAAELLGRKWIGIEIDKETAAAASKRISK